MQEVKTIDYNEKQVQIIETAERLFAAKGFEGTSVRDIAQEAGINIAMISYYFGSKEKLIEAIFAYRISYTRLTMLNVVNDEAMSPTEKMERIIDSYIDKMMRNQCFYKLMAQERSILEVQNISELIYDSKARNMEMVKKILQEGQKKGQFRKNIDVGLLMATMIGTSNHFTSSQTFYRKYNNLVDMPDEDFEKYLKKKLSTYLKTLFKSLLTVQ
jgi:AcrR family transcriptional regulator